MKVKYRRTKSTTKIPTSFSLYELQRKVVISYKENDLGQKLHFSLQFVQGNGVEYAYFVVVFCSRYFTQSLISS